MTADPQAPSRAPEDAPEGGGRAGVRSGSSEQPRLPGGFGRAAGWSVLGTVVPGSGLLDAGRRVWGWVALVPFLFATGAAAVVLSTGSGLAVARRWVFQPQAMLAVAVVAAAVGLLWCVVVVATHLAQRRARGVHGLRAASALLVVVLLTAVAAPAATAARYALSERSLLLSVFGAHQRTAGQGAPDTGARDPWAGTPRVNVLLVGADSSQGHAGTRPDTLIIASINTRTGDSVLIGLPRQLAGDPFAPGTAPAAAWPAACAANGQGGCILNAAYLFGVQHPELFPGAADPGLAATRAAAAGASGLRVDYTAMVNLDGFEHLIDAMGGITLTVPQALPIGGGEVLGDRGQVVGHYPITGYVPAGTDVHLSGYQAEWYARSRASTDNSDRMRRQRCLINAAVKQYSVVDLARAFPALAASAQNDITTDIPASDLNAFVDLGLKVKSAPLRAINIDIDNTDTGNPDYAALHALVRKALVPPVPAPAAAPSPTAGATAAPSATPSAPGPAATAAPGAAVAADSVCPS